ARFPIVAGEERRPGLKHVSEALGPRRIGFADITQRLLLDYYAPAAVLINQKYQILYFHGPTMRYLDQPTGEPTQDLLRMAREGLRAKLRTAVHQALHGQGPVIARGARVKRQDTYHEVQIAAQAVRPSQAPEQLLLVTFEDVPEQLPAQAKAPEQVA